MIALDSLSRRRMTSVNPISSTDQLASRLLGFFDRHPEVAREEFLLHALQKEIESREPRVRADETRGQRPRPPWWGEDRRPVTAEDIRIHAWLNRRLAQLPRRRRRSFWSSLRRFLSRNPLTGWLVPRRR